MADPTPDCTCDHMPEEHNTRRGCNVLNCPCTTFPSDERIAKLLAGAIIPDMSFSEPIMQFFAYEHLPSAMQSVSRPFCELAKSVVETLPRCAERTVALRKLLEAKDAAVRASLPPQ